LQVPVPGGALTVAALAAVIVEATVAAVAVVAVVAVVAAEAAASPTPHLVTSSPVSDGS
jgi:hypothetical protein